MSPKASGSASRKASRAADVAAQKREIAAVQHSLSASEDAVDALAQRRVLPFDCWEVAGLRVEQDCRDLAAGYALALSIKRAELERKAHALVRRKLLAPHEGARTLPGKAAFQAIDGVLARGGVVIARDDKAAASRRAATDEAELMISVRITDQDVMTIVRAHARQDRREVVETDGLRG